MLKTDDFGHDVFDEDVYKYVGVELTPLVFADLLVLLFDGKLFKRNDAINRIVAFHVAHGGVASKSEYVYLFKRVSSTHLKKFLINAGYATWRLNYRTFQTKLEGTLECSGCETDISNDTSCVITADKEVGDGSGSVYVYYYDIYKQYAEQCGCEIWQCKIGMTDGNAMRRIFSQAKTAYPELPHIALIIKSNTPRELESALHSVLRLRGKHIETAPGKEWFLTTPDEVERLYNMFGV